MKHRLFTTSGSPWRSTLLARLPLYLCSSVFICGSPVSAEQKSSLYGKESLQGVYVQDSAIAVEKIALAERLERLKEWNKAAEVYQEIIEQYPDRVVPSGVDENEQIVRYSSVVSAVHERLSRWPVEGLSAYRNKYESSAESLLAGARPDDAPALHRVVSLFFVTDTSRKAALRLIDLQLQNGEFSAAAWLGDRLLTLHPGLTDPQRAAVLYRTAIAYRLADNPDAAKARSDELSEKYASVVGVVRGSEANLAESLKVELRQELGIEGAPADSWPMAFGNLSRDRVPTTAPAAGGARLFSIPITRSLPKLAAAAERQQLVNDDDAREAGLCTGILPSMDSGELYFQDNARVYAVSIDSGLPLPGWADTYAGDRGGRYAVPNAWPTPRGTQLAVALTDDAVFSVLGQSNPLTMLYTPGAPQDARLVCLDRRTGKERWTFSSRQLASQNKPDTRSLQLTGTPIVAGDRVYVTVQTPAGAQFEKCEVIALDRSTGALAWRTYIASASNNVQPWDVEGMTVDETTPQISYANGRVYVCSNLGATAALDAFDGSVAWLDLYPRDLPEFNRFFQMRATHLENRNARRGKPWSHNPVIVSDNRVFTLPRSSNFIFVYDASTGAELARIPTRPFGNADTLIGVTGDRLLIAGANKVTCLNYSKFSPDAEVSKYQPWFSEIPPSQEPSIRGRPFLTSDYCFVPGESRLLRISLATGKLESSYPTGNRKWADDEGPGNLLLTQDHLVIAGPDRVGVYTDLNLAMAKLDAQVQADPTSPQPRLRYAEVMFVGGRYDVATRKLDEAIQLLGGPTALQAGPARDRLFNSALSFARKLSGDSTPSPDVVDGFFDRAAVAALSAQQQVLYRIGRARWARQQNNDLRELALYQELLADPMLRQEPVSGAEGGPATPAAYVAEQGIARIIARNPQVYAATEQQAQALFDTLSTGSGDPERLLGLAQTYPNSRVANKAMFGAADAYESGGNHKAAVSVLRSLLTRELAGDTRVACLESLARNYLRLPNRLEVAASRIAQAAQLSPAGQLSRPLTLQDGKPVEATTYVDAAAALKTLRREANQQKLADLRLPPVRAGEEGPPPAPFVESDAPIDNVSRLLVPPAGASRLDRIVAYQPGVGVSVFDALRPTAPLYATPSNDPPLGCAWVGNNLLFWTARAVTFVRGDDTGRAMWQASLDQIPEVEVSPAGDDPLATVEEGNAPQPNEQLIRRRLVNGRLVVRGNVIINGRRVPLDGVRNAILAGEPRAPVNGAGGNELILQVRCLSDRVVLATNFGRVIALDLADGAAVWQARPTDRPLERLLANDDFIAALFFDDASTQIVAIDAGTGDFVLRRVFNAAGGITPVNLALSPDGKLIWLLPEELVGKDLFDPSDRPTFRRQLRTPDGGPAFGTDLRQPNQMAITDEQILALSDNGQYVRVFSLETGEPVTTASRELKSRIDRRLRTDSNDWNNIQLHVSNGRLYVMGNTTLRAHDLERNEASWNRYKDDDGRWFARDLAATATHLILIEEPSARGFERKRRAGNDWLRILAFDLTPNDRGLVSGALDYRYTVNTVSVVSGNWQVVDGGVWYLGNDRKLHFLRGAAK